MSTTQHLQRAAQVLLGACALSSAALAAAPTAPTSPGALHVKRVEMIDRQGFDRPMTAATMLVPAQWRHEGAVQWRVGSQCHPTQNFRLRAQAPDGSAQIELGPGEGWGVSSLGGQVQDCSPGAFADGREYLTGWVQRHRPGARILGWHPRPDKVGPPQQFNGPNSTMQTRQDASRMSISWSDQGREVHEILSVFTQVIDSQVGGAGMMVRTRQGMAFGVLSWRSNKGPVDVRTFDTLWDTFRRDPAWQARINAGNAAMARENADTHNKIMQIQAQTSRDTLNAMAQRGENARRTREEIADGQMRGYQARDASTDRMQRDNVRTIREVDVFRGSDGRGFELPHHYPHAWKLKDGSFVLTDSAGFDPQRDLGLAGERLQRVK
ncbi:MAG: hypothetical protein ACKVQR_09965 [Aquabacterium sp.]